MRLPAKHLNQSGRVKQLPFLQSVSLHSARPPTTGFEPLKHCLHEVAHH